MNTCTSIFLSAVAACCWAFSSPAALLFCDHVNSAPRTFSERHDGEFTYPYCLRYFKGGVSVVKGSLTYPGPVNDAASNSFGIANGYMMVTPLSRALQMYMNRGTENQSSSIFLAVSFLVRVISSSSPRSWAGASLNLGGSTLVSVNMRGKEPHWRLRGYNTTRQRLTIRNVPFSYIEKETAGTNAHVAAALGQTFFVVMWMRAADHAVYWGADVNPETPADALRHGFTGGGEGLPVFDTLSFDADNAKMIIDEIRIGTSLDDVFPGASSHTIAASRPFELPAAARTSVIAVKGDVSDGTACFAEHNGTVYLYSNTSLLLGNRAVKFIDFAGRLYKPLRIECARDADLVRIVVSNPPTAAFRTASPPSNDTRVAICPHAYGEHDFMPVYGRVLASGPRRVELDAPFTGALMGSPVFTADGRLAGIATHVQEPNPDWVNNDSPFVVTRRFAARLDTVSAWLPLTPQVFAQQGNIIAQRAALMQALLLVMNIWARDPSWSYVPEFRWLPPGLKSWARAHNEARNNNLMRLARGDASAPDAILASLKEDISALRTELQRTAVKPPARWALPYFADSWKELGSAESIIAKALAGAHGIADNF